MDHMDLFFLILSSGIIEQSYQDILKEERVQSGEPSRLRMSVKLLGLGFQI